MRKQVNVGLGGNDLEKFYTIKRSVISENLDIKNSEIFRMCLRYYYEHEIKKREVVPGGLPAFKSLVSDPQADRGDHLPVDRE